MSSLSRRTFLGTSLAGLVASQVLGAEARPAGGKAKPSKDMTGTSAAPQKPFADQETLILTWHRDPSTTMDIQWIGSRSEAADNTIFYAQLMPQAKQVEWKTEPTKLKRFPLSDLFVFRANLAGLAPNTDYQFRVGKKSPVRHFRTMPAKATDTISFISGGDCGTNPHMIANCVQAARQDPMFAVVGGDLAYDNGTSVSTCLTFLRNYSQNMLAPGGRIIPMVTCIGNHEVQGGFGKTRVAAPFYYAMFGDLYPDTGFATLDFGNYLSLVLLDTGHTTPIAGEQTAWLEKTLQARVDHPNVFVVNHCPAYPSHRAMSQGATPASNGGVENRAHWTPLFDKYRVPVVLEHHDHTFKRSKPILNGMAHDDGVLYLGDGSWGRLSTPQPLEKVPLLAVTSKNYHLSLHRIENKQRFHLALDETGRVMDVCRSGQRKTGAG